MANGVLGFFFFTIIGVVTGISVGPVRLIHNQRYITYQFGASFNLTLIECPIQLLVDEKLQEVSWTFSQDSQKAIGHYVWTLESGGRADGRLEGVVRLDRSDGGLELTGLRYDLAGFYSCSATTTDGTTDEAANWEVLIVDTTSSTQEDLVSPREGGSCTIKSTFKVSAIYPEPTLHSGLFSESYGGFVEEVKAIDWHKQKYPNNSYSYSHEDVIFEIDRDTPIDVYILNTVGVTKTDGTYLSLTSVQIFLNEFEERGCPVIKNRAYQTTEYSSDQRTCRDKVTPLGPGQPLEATVKCIDGYKPEGDLESVVLTCNIEKWTWIMPNDMPGLHAFKCVVDNSAFTASGSSVLVMACLLLLRLLQQ